MADNERIQNAGRIRTASAAGRLTTWAKRSWTPLVREDPAFWNTVGPALFFVVVPMGRATDDPRNAPSHRHLEVASVSQDDDRGWQVPGGEPEPERQAEPPSTPPPSSAGSSGPAGWVPPSGPQGRQDPQGHDEHRGQHAHYGPYGNHEQQGQYGLYGRYGHHGQQQAQYGAPQHAAAPDPYGQPERFHGGYGGHRPPPEDKPGIIALRPLNLGDIFNGAFSYIRRNPKATLGLSVVVMAASSALASYGTAESLDDMTGMMQQVWADPFAPVEESAPSAGGLISTFGGALLDIFAVMILTGLLTMLVGHAVLGRRLSMAETWRLAKSRLPAVIGVTLLVGAGFMVLATIVSLIVVGAVVAIAHPLLALLVAALPALGLLALGTWLWVKFALAAPAVVLEEIGPLRGLARSWRLVRGSWWRLFGILLLAMIVVFVIQQILITPFAVASLGFSWFGEGAPWVLPASAASMFLGTLLLAAFTYPFITGVTVLLYLDTRMRREGLDLRLQSAIRSGEALDERVFAPRAAADSLPGGTG
jgi:hypothetical protein